MTKRTLFEEIRRIHEISGIKSEILVEGIINESADPISKEMARIIASFFSGIEKEIMVGTRKVTQTQAQKIVQKIGSKSLTADEVAVVKALTKEAIAADRAIITSLTSDIFGELQKLNTRALKTKYYSEVKAAMKNILPDNEVKVIVKDVNAKLKIPTSGTSSSTSTGTGSNTFTIPKFDIEIPDFWKMDEEATKAAIKNLFPKASGSDTQQIINNLRKMKLGDQKSFDAALMDALKSFAPNYAEKINSPSIFTQVTSKYSGLPNWSKIIFWVCMSPVGYSLLKSLGVPVDRTLGAVIEGWKGIAKDQASSVSGEKPADNTNSGSQTTTYGFDDNGISQWLIKTYPETPVSAYDLRKVTSPYNGYGVKLKTGGTELIFKHENGNYTKAQ